MILLFQVKRLGAAIKAMPKNALISVRTFAANIKASFEEVSSLDRDDMDASGNPGGGGNLSYHGAHGQATTGIIADDGTEVTVMLVPQLVGRGGPPERSQYEDVNNPSMQSTDCSLRIPVFGVINTREIQYIRYRRENELNIWCYVVPDAGQVLTYGSALWADGRSPEYRVDPAGTYADWTPSGGTDPEWVPIHVLDAQV